MSRSRAPAAVPRRDFVLGVINGALVNFGLAFIDPFTVLPVFITRLGGSGALVGLAAAFFGAGWFAPQVVVAREVESRRRVLGIYRVMAAVRIASFVVIAVAIFVMDPARPSAILAVVLAGFAFNALSAGVTGVPFLEVTSRLVPPTARGRFFGLRRFTGGLLGVLAGAIVAAVLDDPARGGAASGPVARAVAALGLDALPFPRDYGALFMLGTVFAAAGYLAFCLVREPESPHVHPRRPLREVIADGMRLLRAMPTYRRFFVVRLCWQATAMAFPFYTPWAIAHLGLHESIVGLFVALWVGSAIVANVVWGWIADRFGNRLVLVLTATMSVAPPVALLGLMAAGDAAPGRAAIVVVATTFLVNGFARSGRFISNMTYLLEFVPQRRRAAYVGFLNSLSALFMLSPLLGGVVFTWISPAALFGVAAVAAVANAALSARLDEPRHSPPDEVSEAMPL